MTPVIVDQIKQFWEESHKNKDILWLSDYSGPDIWNTLKINELIKPKINVLNIGVGTGKCSYDLNKKGVNLYGLDIVEEPLKKLDSIFKNYWTIKDMNTLPKEFFDLAICHLVAQHIEDKRIRGLIIKK